MGFGSIATTIIMFIAVLLLSTGVIMTIRTQVDKSQASMRAQAELLNDQINTVIDISSTNYTANITTIYVLNNGKTTLDIEKIDVYLDDIFVPRNTSNRTIVIEPSTDTKNPGLWDPDEILRITVNRNLNSGTHWVLVSTQFASSDRETFSI